MTAQPVPAATVDWFAGLGRRFTLDTRAEALRLFGLSWSGAGGAGSDQALEHLCERILTDPAALFAAADPMMVLLTARNATGTAVGQYRAAVVAAIEAGSPDSLRHPKSVALLVAAGALAPEAGPAHLATAVVGAPTLDALLDRAPAAVSRLCSAIGVLTQDGTRPLPPDAIGAPRLDGLAALMLSDCRHYDLVWAATILRALTYAGAAAEAVHDAHAFFALQRRDAGGYGHLNPLAAGPRPDERWEEVEFRLPISAAVIWALHPPEVSVA